ncbi:MAG TPA: aminotransferase class V-fold PLP-dependent enzyme [Candidatus Baltobacteraceae bacterium]|nr:aminotransferase class V-fold PLP-dependent enzyme [Candidatus Baltobacteraceae bacterium]
MTTPLPRSEFAVTQRYVYLNNASAGPLPRSSEERIAEFARAQSEEAVLGTFPHDLRMTEYRDRIGNFIGASGSEIAIVVNTGAGANVIALGIGWSPGDEVLLCDNEFPANSVPWLALRRRGVEVRMLPTRRERLTPEVLRRELSPRTRLVALSWISYAEGYRHDLTKLAEVAHQRGVLLCVDAMQGLGAFPLDVRETGVDAVYAGAAKWMLGLHGVGFLYVRPQLLERLQLAMPGWRSVQNMWDFHNYEQPLSTQALKFEGGTPNLIGTISMVSAIDLFERSGPREIAEHVLALTDRLCAGLERLGAEISSLRGASTSSGIVTFRLPPHDSIALGEALQKEGIVTTYRSTGVRVSPHGYNTEEEIDRLLERLPCSLH